MGKKALPYVGVLLAAIASGTLLCLSLPLGEQSYLAWVMLVPLLIATKKKGFFLGFLGGLGAVFWCAYLATTGVFYHHKYVDGLPDWVYTVCGIFAVSFSLTFGIYAEQKKADKPIWWIAALAVCAEAILLLEIPAHVALTQYRNWTMMLLTSVGGIWMVSFLVWLVNLYVAQDIKKRYPIATAICAMGFLIPLMNPFPRSADQSIVIGAAQITDGLEKELVDTHRSAAAKQTAFVVWPEFAGMLFVRGDDTAKLKEISRDSVPLITSFRDAAEPLPHNVASLFVHGVESPRYEKRKLFGSESKMHTAGSQPVAVPLSALSGRVGLNICYDSCFPYILRETAKLSDVKVVALPTIDPDSIHHFMAAMHAAYTPFRAAENGIAIVRADGNYGSMIVNERGTIVSEFGSQQGLLTGHVSGQKIWTLAGFLGDWFLYLSLISTLSYPVFVSIKKRNSKP